MSIISTSAVTMKFFLALVVASLCVAAYSSPVDLDVEERGIWESTVNSAKKLKAKLSEALSAAKGKLSEFVKVLGEQKDVALVKLNELKDQLVAEAKQKAKESVDKAIGKAKQQAAQVALAEIEKVLGELNGLKQKIDSLKQ